MQHESRIYKYCKKKLPRLEGEPLSLFLQCLLPQKRYELMNQLAATCSLIASIYVSDVAAWPEALLC